MTMWGGRFGEAPAPLFRQINDSLAVDARLLDQDVRGSIAWAKALARAKVITEDERGRIAAALEEIGRRGAADPAAVVASGEEDIHSWVEARLVERVGDLGKKLHTGRSRNDQVATDFRLFVREANTARVKEVREACAALIALGEREARTVFPGYTHLQRAQPVLLGHWCLAYVEMLERDAGRFADASTRAGLCPLGSGALAGTAFVIDRDALARDLGFEGPTRNSLDAVSDRDFVVEALGAAATCAIHLSRLAEDLIIYSSGEFALVEIPDGFSSGSSLMPQKKNPDALEVMRGSGGRLLGDFVAMAATLKGLPLAYNKDLQDDKAPLFDAMDRLSLCLRVLPPLLGGLRVNREACRRAAERGYSTATDLADYLVERGIAFRDAHEMVGKMVRLAIEKKVGLAALPVAEMRSIAPVVEESVKQRLTLEASLERKNVAGGTAPARVAEALKVAKARLVR